MALQRGNLFDLLREHHDHRMKCRCSHLVHLHLLNFNIHAYRLCADGPKKK